MIWRWRVGRKVGRTLYRHLDDDADGVLIGMMDTKEDALLAASAPDLLREVEALRRAADYWLSTGTGFCPECYCRVDSPDDGHRGSCLLGAALALRKEKP